MDDLIRGTIQEALAVDPPAGLRARVIGAVPMEPDRARRPRLRSLRLGPLTAGFAAGALTVAIVAGLVYSRTSPGTHVSPTQQASGTRLSSPEGIAVGPDGTVYVSDFVADRVYRLQDDGSLVVIAGGGSGFDGPATKANLWHPAGLTVGPDGLLYVADAVGGTIRKLDRGGVITTLHAPYWSLSGPLGIAFDSVGILYIGDFSGELFTLDGNGNLASIDSSALPPPHFFPGYLAFDAKGDLFVSDRSPEEASGLLASNPRGGCRIVRMTPDHQMSVIAGTGTCGYGGDGGPATKAQLNDPNGIAFDSAGNLYFSDSYNHRIRRIDTRGIITTVAGTGAVGHGGDGGPASKATLSYPFGLGMGNGNLLYVSDATCPCVDPVTPGRVRLIHLSDGTITTVASGQSRVISPP